MDVWGPARVRGQGHECYFLLVVDDYSRYTTVFPLRTKGEVPEVLNDWICGTRRQLCEIFGLDLPVLRRHSDRGGEFSSDLLRAFCHAEGIRQMFTLPASPQRNGIAERRIGMVMDVARTSMIHAAAPHFLWPFVVQYAAHQINLQPRVSLQETTRTLRWTGKVGDVSAFRVWGSQAFVRDTSTDKLSSRAVPCVFLGIPPDAPGWQFYHPTSRCVMSSQDVMFDEYVSYYRLFPYHTASFPPPATLPSTSAAGATGGAAAAGAAGGAAGAAGGAAGAGDAAGAEGAAGSSGGAARAGAAGGAASVGAAGAAGGAAGAGAAGSAGGAAGTGDPGAEGTGSVSPVSGGAAWPRPYYIPLLQQVLGSPPSPGPPPPFLSPQPVQSQSHLQPASPLPGPSPYSRPTRGLTERREPESRPVSRESRSASPVRTIRAGRVSRPRPPPVPSTHSITLRPSTAPQRVPLPSPPASSLPAGPNPESDSLRAASPTLVDFAAACRLDYATSLVAESASVSDCPPSVGGECALGTDVLEDRHEEFECFAATVPHLVSMLIAPVGDLDATDIPTPRSYVEAIEGPYFSQWQAAMDVAMASWKSTNTYVDEVPPPGANSVSGMWIFRVKRPPGSPRTFKARYVARGFSQWQGVDFFQTFSPTPKMTTLRVLLHVAAQREYELHSLDFSTAFLQSSLHEEIWLRRPPGFTGSFPPDDLVFATADTEALTHVKSELQKRHTCTDLGELTSYLGLRITRDRAQRTITLTQSHMVQQVLQRFGFTYSSPQSTPLPTGHSLSALPLDESVEPSGPYPELVDCLITSSMGLVLGGRARVVLTGHADASWVDDLATQRSSQGYTFSLCSGSVSWRSTRSSSALSSSCEAEIYAGAMAAQELRMLTYLLTN
ncbi:unnamed protein product [Closterium sp. NIES-54]